MKLYILKKRSLPEFLRYTWSQGRGNSLLGGGGGFRVSHGKGRSEAITNTLRNERLGANCHMTTDIRCGHSDVWTDKICLGRKLKSVFYA